MADKDNSGVSPSGSRHWSLTSGYVAGSNPAAPVAI